MRQKVRYHYPPKGNVSQFARKKSVDPIYWVIIEVSLIFELQNKKNTNLGQPFGITLYILNKTTLWKS